MHYELTNNKKEYLGRTVTQIRATKDLPSLGAQLQLLKDNWETLAPKPIKEI